MDRQEEEILKRVSCLGSKHGRETLSKSRDHSDVHTYYQLYAKAGMAGILKAQSRVQMRI